MKRLLLVVSVVACLVPTTLSLSQHARSTSGQPAAQAAAAPVSNGPVPLLPVQDPTQVPSLGTVNVFRSHSLTKAAQVEVHGAHEVDKEQSKEPSETADFQHSVLQKQQEALSASDWFSRQLDALEHLKEHEGKIRQYIQKAPASEGRRIM
ncbi:hypothetical protein TGME49_207955 [Toxoplasma gondii ME49]|uniref:Uncharacterized protein n=14 Tax=Toxoplasma gondii TaxID=5811 RepID=A0A125YW83_TOXGV|nr:hypothetical protein TGME49_207955 [Toxoplasma gondii ME49]EPR58010.1 hypothetical protein TGGT1_207955 [Toxoplasma gondii GT1]ESS29411.1 hypothetical protein TGVEG_207955 [Toxoplasma gondii VEG]KAF4645995.1 hypothetical protein TGRH88_022710 [Toxoplasma gondii]KFG30560.1 hypothetical protein TGP89_207955 [Toxoplasma gondii p89]KFG35085.1 hypothetical protein TGDOM2_207955 [Toxoplasma gondii GAB2-2007-GAL-DOM2]KFG49228.1 hypothetical protein TGFOU_207955 [Toxoplasma gondii FOU]KFG60631.1 |eukprot:XP_018638500.1 hypothetical protein TGME49_207955 [Toxoplasma gondii ME49]